MNKKLFALLFVLLALFTVSTVALEAVWYPPCDTHCPSQTSYTKCMCPSWSDRPYHVVTCGGWNQVGGCWYE